jgi:hypothetical protein
MDAGGSARPRVDAACIGADRDLGNIEVERLHRDCLNGEGIHLDDGSAAVSEKVRCAETGDAAGNTYSRPRWDGRLRSGPGLRPLWLGVAGDGGAGAAARDERREIDAHDGTASVGRRLVRARRARARGFVAILVQRLVRAARSCADGADLATRGRLRPRVEVERADGEGADGVGGARALSVGAADFVRLVASHYDHLDVELAGAGQRRLQLDAAGQRGMERAGVTDRDAIVQISSRRAPHAPSRSSGTFTQSSCRTR